MKFILLILLLVSINQVIADNAFEMTSEQLNNLGVKTAPLQVTQQTPLLSAPAKVVIPPSQEYIVSNSQAGLVSQLNVSIGERVVKNQALALLNSAELLSLQRIYLKANNQQQLAFSAYQRDKKLVKEGIIPESRWQQTRYQYQSFEAEVNEAQQLLKIAGMSAKAIQTLANQKKLTSGLTLYSPIDGVVLKRLVTAGQRLDSFSPIYHIANLKQLWLDISVPQEYINQLNIGDHVQIKNTVATAKISLISQQVNSQNQTILVRAVMNNSTSPLRVGQNVNTQIIKPLNQTSFLIPSMAIAQHEGQTYIFIRNQTGFIAQPVQVLGKQQHQSIITSHDKLNTKTNIAIHGTVALKATWLGLGAE